jgi:hypothetical protein
VRLGPATLAGVTALLAQWLSSLFHECDQCIFWVMKGEQIDKKLIKRKDKAPMGGVGGIPEF